MSHSFTLRECYVLVSISTAWMCALFCKPLTYLYKCGQEHTAHLLLQDDFVLLVVVAGADEGREEHFDEVWVAEVLERQLTQFLQHAGLPARLHYHLEHTGKTCVHIHISSKCHL